MIKITYNLKISEIRNIQENTKLWNKTIAENLTLKIRDILYEETKKETPVVTGYLKSGWKHGGITHSGKAFRTKVYNDVRYAEFVEYGAKGRDDAREETLEDVYYNFNKRKAFLEYHNKKTDKLSLFQSTSNKRLMLLKGTLKAQDYVDKIVRGGII
ncbi:HK97 gp10 family phage protein [Streptobacillus moniliformis]|uniref:HK97 gp10 family phage protein n=1 Tax=Streptobacillus moniliformis TaxID=34105 RepID=UPI0007E4216C|nr:HK97 gp10 family phage protein [Streptobacillus moniliformis]